MPGVVVVIGAGGIGLAAARRLGPGRRVVLADRSAEVLAAASAELTGAGFAVDTRPVDITARADVRSLAEHAASLDAIAAVVLTAGVSPHMAGSRDIYRIDLVGACHVIDEFCEVATAGTAVTCVASMAGYRERVAPELEELLAGAPADRLLDLPELDADGPDTRRAYLLAKRGLQLRVQLAAIPYGRRGARINSVSPGIITTPMGRSELAGPVGDDMRTLIANSPAARVGVPEDIAAAVAFLSGPEAGFVTGTDLLVDGGATVVRRWQRPSA